MNLGKLGSRIRERRESRGLKQADVAHALQISAQAVSKWERGENAPDISLLAGLAKLLGVSIEWLLGVYQQQRDDFDATVLVSSVLGYAKKATELPLKELALWSNSLLFLQTETVLENDGVPVKQLGDGLLCFFSGQGHRQRALAAARTIDRLSGEPLKIVLDSGQVYLGTLGHPDYASLDILGDPVNVCFLVLNWLSHRQQSSVLASQKVVKSLDDPAIRGENIKIELGAVGRTVELVEILTN